MNEPHSVSEPCCQLSGVGMDAGGSLGRHGVAAVATTIGIGMDADGSLGRLQFLSLGANFLGLEWMRGVRWRLRVCCHGGLAVAGR